MGSFAPGYASPLNVLIIRSQALLLSILTTAVPTLLPCLSFSRVQAKTSLYLLINSTKCFSVTVFGKFSMMITSLPSDEANKSPFTSVTTQGAVELVIPSPADTLVAAVDVLPLFDLAKVFSLCHFGNDAVTQLAESGGKDSCGLKIRLLLDNFLPWSSNRR